MIASNRTPITEIMLHITRTGDPFYIIQSLSHKVMVFLLYGNLMSVHDKVLLYNTHNSYELYHLLSNNH